MSSVGTDIQMLWQAATKGDAEAKRQLIHAVRPHFERSLSQGVFVDNTQQQLVCVEKCQKALAKHFDEVCGESFSEFLRWLDSMARVIGRRLA